MSHGQRYPTLPGDSSSDEEDLGDLAGLQIGNEHPSVLYARYKKAQRQRRINTMQTAGAPSVQFVTDSSSQAKPYRTDQRARGQSSTGTIGSQPTGPRQPGNISTS